MTANRAVLDIASRNRENVALQHLPDGEELDRARQHATRWTTTPRRVIAARQAAATADAVGATPRPATAGGGGRGGAAHRELFQKLLRDPADARSARLHPARRPAGLPDRDKFVNALLKTGVTVHRATAPFTVGGKSYPAGSYVVKTAQAFRPHVLDMFEPQDHPDDIPVSGRPADAARTTTPAGRSRSRWA